MMYALGNSIFTIYLNAVMCYNMLFCYVIVILDSAVYEKCVMST